ncbi:MAG: PLP-dependent transferase [Oscillospiraceae bacterium]|nr:PLP-dependent transferase [Oscillospiraceae bacterium]
MNTPICDFAREYKEKKPLRFHMPGHKGNPCLGCEPWDITEIPGADSLYDADGIIRQSELNAGRLFGARTFYSAEGSSLAIRAMLSLACQHARANGKSPLIWAGRNAHSAFLSAAALLDFSVEWLYSSGNNSYLSCPVDAAELDEKLKNAPARPTAVYITSPDYLGSQADVKSLSDVCHKYAVLLLVDNAHGAYLKFLPWPAHPMELGADICCDSAHKTLPVLTGGAYLHLSESMACFSDREVKESLRLFGSTSPSFLILQSLDRANRCLAEEFPTQLHNFLPLVEKMKERLTSHGYTLIGTEPLKLTLSARDYGYTGAEMAALLSENNIIAEFFDPDYFVFMLAPSLEETAIAKLTDALTALSRKQRPAAPVPRFTRPQAKMSVREASMASFETLPIEQCLGRTLARASVGCPPAVPILVCGEVIDENAISCFRYYGIDVCNVIREHP